MNRSAPRIVRNRKPVKGFRRSVVARPAALNPGGNPPPDHDLNYEIRSNTMSLLVEELSRDRLRQAQRDMEGIRLARRLRTARRQRRQSVPRNNLR